MTSLLILLADLFVREGIYYIVILASCSSLRRLSSKRGSQPLASGVGRMRVACDSEEEGMKSMEGGEIHITQNENILLETTSITVTNRNGNEHIDE